MLKSTPLISLLLLASSGNTLSDQASSSKDGAVLEAGTGSQSMGNNTAAFEDDCSSCTSSTCTPLPVSYNAPLTVNCPSGYYSYVKGIAISTTNGDIFSYTTYTDSTKQLYYTSCSNSQKQSCVGNSHSCGNGSGATPVVVITCRNPVQDCNLLYDITWAACNSITTTPTANTPAPATPAPATPAPATPAPDTPSPDTPSPDTPSPDTPATDTPATDTSTGNFAGTYTRSSVSPDTCVVTSSCDYQCSAVYTITVLDSTATINPTTNPSGCSCETLTATIDGDTAAGSGSTSTYELTLTSSGIQVVASTSGVDCTGSYTKTTTTTTTKSSNDGRAYSTAGLVGLLASALVTFYHA